MKDMKMSISLRCNVCANDQFTIQGENVHDLSDTPNDTKVKCSDCGRIVNKEQLIEENSHIVAANIEDLKKEAIKKIEKDVKKMFKKWK